MGAGVGAGAVTPSLLRACVLVCVTVCAGMCVWKGCGVLSERGEVWCDFAGFSAASL